ncbi:MAG: PQQ-binding-like beta-propeller repeat protein [Chitinophagales bacterium]|nr:PQQ-binding-like beta-propeller repeat protein [Chitinophagales bacterium]
MKILQTLLFLFLSHILLGQERNFQKEETDNIANRNGVHVPAVRLYNTHRMVQHHADSANKLLFASFVKTDENGKLISGFIAAIDINTKEIRWQIPVSENPLFNLSTDKIIHQEKKDALACYDAKTGKLLWKKAYRLAYASPEHDFAISKLGTVLELKEGNIVYKRNFTENDIWNDVQYLDKDNIVIACDGLHSVNLKTGYGWYYAASTFCRGCIANDRTEDIITNAALIASMILAGTVVIWTNAPENGDNAAGYCSNIIVNDDRIYFASKDKMLCLNKQGRKIWSSNLPKDSASKSAIFLMGDNIFFINKGYGIHNGKPLWRGENFIALYNKQNGTKAYSKSFEATENSLSYLLSGDTMLVHGGNYLHKINCSTGATIAKRATDSNTATYTTFANPDKYYEYTGNNNFESIAYKYPQMHLLTDKAGNAILLNEQLESVKNIPAENCWQAYKEYGNILLLRNNTQTVVLQNGNEILRAVGIDAEIIGNKLVCTNKNTVDIIDL